MQTTAPIGRSRLDVVNVSRDNRNHWAKSKWRIEGGSKNSGVTPLSVVSPRMGPSVLPERILTVKSAGPGLD